MSLIQMEHLARRYAALENRVQQLMDTACSPACAACPKVCCRPEMCRESLESPFLVLVREAKTNRTPWSKQQGWLGAEGCRLRVGRPPVCYEFLCQAILGKQPDEKAQTQLKSLTRLLTQAGQRALGGDHLVEIMTMERLAQVKPQRLAARLKLAEAKMADQESFWKSSGGLKR